MSCGWIYDGYPRRGWRLAPSILAAVGAHLALFLAHAILVHWTNSYLKATRHGFTTSGGSPVDALFQDDHTHARTFTTTNVNNPRTRKHISRRISVVHLKTHHFTPTPLMFSHGTLDQLSN